MSVSATFAGDRGSVHGSGVERQSSRLFSSLFSRADQARRLTVFDAGPANTDTVRFLSQFRTRIHISDLYSESLVREQQVELNEAELKAGFQELLGFRVGTLIDVCLFWDFLNYLNRPALRAFSAALKPYIHPGTRAHGFSVLNVETPLRNQQYGIWDVETLCVRPARQSQPDYFPHAHDELNDSLSCFNIGRGWLLPDGRLEILLDACV